MSHGSVAARLETRTKESAIEANDELVNSFDSAEAVRVFRDGPVLAVRHVVKAKAQCHPLQPLGMVVGIWL